MPSKKIDLGDFLFNIYSLALLAGSKWPMEKLSHESIQIGVNVFLRL